MEYKQVMGPAQELIRATSRFSGENYHLWKRAVSADLTALGVANVLTTPPSETSDKQKDAKVFAYLINSLAPEIFESVQDSTSSYELWSSLEKIYAAKTIQNSVHLFQELTLMKMHDGTKMSEHIAKFKSLVTRIKSTGTTIDTQFQVTMLLNSLPTEYDHLVVAINASMGEEDLEWNLVVSKLQQEELRLQASSIISSSEAGLFANARGGAGYAGKWQEKRGPEGTNPNLRKKGPCFKCGKMGHIRRECRGTQRVNLSQIKKDDKHGDVFAFALYTENINDITHWYLDSGASCHLCCNKSLLRNYKSLKKKVDVHLADNHIVPAVGVGTIEFTVDGKSILLKNIYHVPALSTNLLSISSLAKLDYKVTFVKDNCFSNSRKNEAITSGKRVNGLYRLNLEAESKRAMYTRSGYQQDTKSWHERYGHLSLERLKVLANRGLITVDNINTSKPFCEDCIFGKHSRGPFKATESKSSGPLELLHSDVCGPFQSKSLGLGLYFLTIIDDYSSFVSVSILKDKKQVGEEVQKCIESFEVFHDKKVKAIRTDNGKEYVNHGLKNYFVKKGIDHQTTIPYSPQQNGKAERMNRTLLETARTMMVSSGLPIYLWGELIKTSSHLYNLSPRSQDGKIPAELFNLTLPPSDRLHPIGCVAYMHIPGQKRGKFDSKSTKVFLVGYCQAGKSYRLYDPAMRKVVTSRDVKFDETKYWKNVNNVMKVNMDATDLGKLISKYKFSLDEDLVNSAPVEQSETLEVSSETESISELDEDYPELPHIHGSEVGLSQVVRRVNPQITSFQEHDYQSPLIRRSQRLREKKERQIENERVRSDTEPERFGDFVHLNLAKTEMIEPNSYDQAINSEDGNLWNEAMQKEYDNLLRMHTWDIVDLPPGRKPIGSKWVFKLKHEPEKPVLYKARLVAQGFSQVEGLDYEETFAPVVRYDSLRALLAFASAKRYFIDQLDVTGAYLNAYLKEEIYMRQPKGFEVDGRNKVCLLKRSLYGLKQAGREWNLLIDETIKQFGFHSSSYDPSVYFKYSNGSLCLVVVYVDDILIICPTDILRKEIKGRLLESFKCRDLGEVSTFLGIRVLRKDKNVYLSQEEKINDLLEKFKMSGCNPAPSPCAVDLRERLENVDVDKDCNFPVREAIGALNHMMVTSRPDICYAVSLLSRYMDKPSQAVIEGIKRVFRYLRGTSKLCLCLSDGPSQITCYSDSDWAGDLASRKSTSGMALLFLESLVAWHSKKQSCVSLSTTEAEYVGLTEAAKTALWLHEFLREIGLLNDNPIYCKCDNSGAVELSKSSQYRGRSKHIEIRYHFIRQLVEQCKVEVGHVPSQDMLADIFTKPLAVPKFIAFRDMLGDAG